MSLEVIKPGILTTLQDAGRTGYASMGIHPTGAMDREAFFLANALVGNPDNTVAIEMHFPAAVFLFHEDSLIAVAGADWEPTINDEPIAVNQTIMIKAGSVFRCRRPIKGARCYLAIAGGLDIPVWLGGYSTDLSARAGGWMGRALLAGDRIPIKRKYFFHTTEGLSFRWRSIPFSEHESATINLLPGPEFNWLEEDGCAQLIEQEFVVSPNSDRMGIRMKSKKPLTGKIETMISSAVLFGTVQLLPNGELIILMADHPTTGGYPRIAHVPYFEWSLLAQKTSGDTIRFLLNESVEDIFQRSEAYRKTATEIRSAIRVELQSYLEQYVTER